MWTDGLLNYLVYFMPLLSWQHIPLSIVHYGPTRLHVQISRNAPLFCDKTQMLHSFTTNKTRHTDLLTKNGGRSTKVYCKLSQE